MGVFFRFNKKGEVQVAKTLFSTKISEEEFEEKSKVITKEKFLSKYRKEKQQLSEEIEMLEKINEMKISAVGAVSVYLEGEGFCLCGAIIGDKYFPGFYENHNKKQAAIEYGYEFYGRVIMNQIIENKLLDEKKAYDILYGLSDVYCSSNAAVYFFLGKERIDEQTYLKYKGEQDRLTKIRNASSPLKNISDNAKKNNRK